MFTGSFIDALIVHWTKLFWIDVVLSKIKQAKEPQLYFSLLYLYLYLFYSPHDYNNYKEMPKKKCRKKWQGGVKETIELMLIRPPQLQFFEDGIEITATDTK